MAIEINAASDAKVVPMGKSNVGSSSKNTGICDGFGIFFLWLHAVVGVVVVVVVVVLFWNFLLTSISIDDDTATASAAEVAAVTTRSNKIEVFGLTSSDNNSTMMDSRTMDFGNIFNNNVLFNNWYLSSMIRDSLYMAGVMV